MIAPPLILNWFPLTEYFSKLMFALSLVNNIKHFMELLNPTQTHSNNLLANNSKYDVINQHTNKLTK